MTYHVINHVTTRRNDKRQRITEYTNTGNKRQKLHGYETQTWQER